MAKQNGRDLVIGSLKNNPLGMTVAALAEATGMSTNGASATISQINKESDSLGVRINGKKIDGSACYIYRLEYLDNKPAPAKKEEKPRLVAMAPLAPSVEQSSEYLAHYIASKMREEFDVRLAAVLRPAIESGISAMMSNIRTAMADAFRLPESIVAEVVNAEPIAAPEKQTFHGKAIVEVIKDERAEMAIIPAPVVNVLSTRTKHRDKTKPVVEATAAVNEAGRLKKVFIVGLHSNKQEIIRREFRDCFDLRIYNPDQLVAVQKAIGQGETALLIADFVSHKHQDALESAGANIIIVRGGMTHLRETLTSLYVGDEKAAA